MGRETTGIRHRLTLSLHPRDAAWLWHLEATNTGAAALSLDAILIQDIGLGDRGFLMNNEAYASQYIDHHIARHPIYGPVVMSRQNLAQGGSQPLGCAWMPRRGEQLCDRWAAALRSFLSRRRCIWLCVWHKLAGRRLQHELACAAIQSAQAMLAPGARAAWRFFGLYVSDHAEASRCRDLARLDGVAWDDPAPIAIALAPPIRSVARDAPPP